MDGPKELIWGELNPDGTIKVLGRTDINDPHEDPPEAYLKAAKRGKNICFDDQNEKLLERIEKPAHEKKGAAHKGKVEELTEGGEPQ